MSFLGGAYLWLKAFHLIAMVAWMAGMFYLPRLFVYHSKTAAGSETSETFKTMEHKLLKIIMNPALIATWVFGLAMIAADTSLLSQGWLHGKLVLLIGLSGFHGFLAANVRKFAADANTIPEATWRKLNEVPSVLLIVIVLLAVLKPF